MTGTLMDLTLTSLPALLYLFFLHVFLCETISRDMGTRKKEDRTMGTNKDTRCSDYLGIACIDGTCPKIYHGEYIPVVEDCADCGIYEGCDGCYFKGTKFCEKRDTDFRGVVIHENTPDLYEPTEGGEHL